MMRANTLWVRKSTVFRKSVKLRSDRQLLVSIVLSRMMSPDAWISDDSMSSLLVPVLPRANSSTAHRP